MFLIVAFVTAVCGVVVTFLSHEPHTSQCAQELPLLSVEVARSWPPPTQGLYHGDIRAEISVSDVG